MSDPIAELRGMFADIPNSQRHLIITHDVGVRRRHEHSHTPESSVFDSPDEYKEYFKRRYGWVKDLGFGGVVINVSRNGYLEDEEGWALFLAGFAAAKELGLRIWIYDEEGYPSGRANGIVLRDHPEYEAQGLVRMCECFDPGEVAMRPPTGWLYNVRALALFENEAEPVDVTDQVGEDGYVYFKAPGRCTVVRYDSRRAFEGTHAALNVNAVRRYVNLIKPEAVDYFFQVTAERYLERLGDDASYVEAFFTDEPSFMSTYFPEVPEIYRGKIRVVDEPQEEFDKVPMIAWDDSLPMKFYERWKYDLIPELDRLYEGNDPRDLRVRHDFYQMLSEVYAESYFGSQQRKLEARGIQFSGHVLAEESIIHHVASEASTMANLKQMGIPGIDMLNSLPGEILNSIRLLTCKYATSAAHVMGRREIMTEASQWDQLCRGREVSFDERRGALAIQFGLGLTTLASYYPWQKDNVAEARPILDFWARLSTVVRNSTHIADIAVLYPIRTAWAWFKPAGEVLTPELMDEPLRSMDESLYKIARTIVGEGLDFDFIDTRDLISSEISDGRISITDESYSLLIVPPGAVMCPKDLERVEELVRSGGHLLAFEPVSDVALPDIDWPPTGVDRGPGRTPAEVISALQAQYPDKVKQVTPDQDWIKIARDAASDDIRMELEGENMIARRSVCSGTDFVVLVNASDSEAGARVDFGSGRTIQVWNPQDGSIADVDYHDIEVPVAGYSAVILVSERVKK